MKLKVICFILFCCFQGFTQDSIATIHEINIDNLPPNQIKKYWLKMTNNGIAQPIVIPIIIAKGNSSSPVLGLTAAIHGNELNGIPIIQQLIDGIDIKALNGTILAIPGLNSISIPLHQRRFIDNEDINRSFPGKTSGNRSQQFAWQINQKILPKINFLVDMHTASFGRINTLYVRADIKKPQILKMALLQDADIILNSKGPSSGDVNENSRTLRAEAMLKGIPTITVEYGNPQVYQSDFIERGKRGIENIMRWLKMTASPIPNHEKAILCSSSFWIYTKNGGYLDVFPELNQNVKAGDLIATLRNPFGDVLEEYYAPQDGIVIGKSTNPINMTGGRILHLGIPAD